MQPKKSVNNTRVLTTTIALAMAATAYAERNYLAWGNRYNPAALSSTQRGVAVTTDRRGNVAATGYNDVSGDTWYTAKYDALTGAPVWQKTLSNGIGDDRPAAIATDSEGHVIVAGFITTSKQRDFYTVKYDASTGNVIWARLYNNANQDGADEIVAVAIGADDSVVVTGKSVDNGKQEDFYTIKYNSAGTEQWAKRYSTTFPDKPRALAIAPNGDVVVTGSSRVGSSECYYTARYRGSDGLLLWDETYDNTTFNDSDVATDVAVDSAGAVIVTGSVRNTNGTYSYHTIKYPSGGGMPTWSRTYNGPGGNELDTPFVGVDADDNVLVAGTAKLDGFKTVYYGAKYNKDSSSVIWQNTTTAPAGSPANTFVDDDANDMVVDASGNMIVTGTSYVPETGDDLLTVKFDGSTGDLLWTQRLNGDADSGNDSAAAVAVDAGGNVAVVGTTDKGNQSAFSQMVTVKYNRFLLSVGDLVKGPGLTSAAFASVLNVPAVADDGTMAVRITVKDGKKLYGAILPQGAGGNVVSALQGQPAVGVANGKYATFNDPICAPNGTYAFIGKMTGVPGTEATGVWTTTFTGNLQLALQVGKQVPGLPAGTLLKSVTGITLRNGYLAALVTLKGTGVSGTNSTAIVGLTSPTVGYELMRTGRSVTFDSVMTTVKKLSIYTPPKTSPGHGRWHGDFRLVASLGLADKRTALVALGNTGLVSPLATTKGDASTVVAGAKWKTLGAPAIGSTGFYYTALAMLEQKVGGVTAATDQVLIAKTTVANTFSKLAIEGGDATGIPNGTFLSFTDPISNNQARYAFMAKAKGTGINGSNNTGIWTGVPGALDLVARTGGTATDAGGFDTAAKFLSFSSLALSGGNGGGPLFLAKIKGTGVNGKNNAGLWGTDSEGFLRQLLRNGDEMGPYTVSKFTVLSSVVGSLNNSRSFNNTGGVVALVSFSDKSKAIVRVGIP